jgi:hypothetical protein
MVKDRNVRRGHVRQMLQEPERKNGFGPGGRESAHIERTVSAEAPPDGVNELADVNGRDAGAHAYAKSPRVEAAGLEACVIDRKRSRTDGKPHGPAHHLHVLFVFTQEGENVEVLHLSCDLDVLAVRVETLDEIDTGSALEDRIAEIATPDAVWRNHSDSGHHHAVHFFPHAQSLQKLKGAVRAISRSSVLSLHGLRS